MAKQKLPETALYHPVKNFLTELGWTVRGEVHHCDIAAVRHNQDGDEELLVVELKKGFTLDLVVQGTQRQKSADLVYLAIPRPTRFWFVSKWRDNMHLLRRLEIGLILVDHEGNIEVVLEPKAFDRSRSRAQNKRKRGKIVNELKTRKTDLNTGGSTRVPLMTAYRERSLSIAFALREGPKRAVELRTTPNDTKTAALLRRNVYGWFEHVDRGIYGLSETGRQASTSFAAEHPEYGDLSNSGVGQDPADLGEEA